ncbi:MAG TPA: DUF3501 family protein [Candidatus Acidoferrales bacterium]|nr:DUF3501 family protein [Candidatus Acidoferrales bacterium]
MKKIELSDIKNILEYEKIRNNFRNKIIAMKKERRLKVGDRITLTFENRYTVTFQIEEMMRIERIVDEEKINSEIEAYNELIPADNELSATLFVEVDEKDLIKPVLDSLVGMNKNSVFLQVGAGEIPAIFEEGQFSDDRISAVQYVKFRLSQEDIKALTESSIMARVVIRHPNYNAAADFPDEMRKSLLKDFTQGDSVNVWN